MNPRRAVSLLLALTLISATLLQISLLARLNFDGENSGLESEALCALGDVAEGRPLYRDYNAPPHLQRVYMPLFYWGPGLVARAMHATGLSAFVIGRTCVYLAWLGVGVVIWGLTRDAGGGRLPALLAAALWFSGQVAPEWAVSYRPDMPALLFSFAGLLLYRRGHRVAAIGLLVVAFFHKQSTVAALAAILLEEALSRRFVRMMWWGAVWTTAVAGLILLSEKVTGGTFLLNVFGPLGGLAAWERPAAIFQAAVVAGVSVFAAAGLSYWPVNSRHCPRVLRFYFVIALAWAALSSMKYASYVNYYLEPFAAGCVLTGCVVQGWQSGPTRTQTVWLGLALAVLAMTVFTQLTSPRPALAAAERDLAQAITALRPLRGPTLIEDPYLALRQPAQPPFMIDVTQFAGLQQKGKFDDSAIIHAIEAGQFKAIVTHRPLDAAPAWRLPARWVEPMRRRYTLVAAVAPSYYLYRPAP